MHLVIESLELFFHDFICLLLIPKHHLHQIKLPLHQAPRRESALHIHWPCSIRCNFSQFHRLFEPIEPLFYFAPWLLRSVHHSSLSLGGIACDIAGPTPGDGGPQSAENILIVFGSPVHFPLA